MIQVPPALFATASNAAPAGAIWPGPFVAHQDQLCFGSELTLQKCREMAPTRSIRAGGFAAVFGVWASAPTE